MVTRFFVKSMDEREMLLMRSHWISRGQVKPPGPAQAHACSLAEEKLKNWYSWKETCGDFIVEQDCHGVDVLYASRIGCALVVPVMADCNP